MEIAVLGIDLGKTVRSVAGLDGGGAVVFRKRIQRFRLLDFLAKLPTCVVAMEACGGAHHIGHFCLEQGHKPRLMSPLYVRPYVKVHENDERDAEAATQPTNVFCRDQVRGTVGFASASSSARETGPQPEPRQNSM